MAQIDALVVFVAGLIFGSGITAALAILMPHVLGGLFL